MCKSVYHSHLNNYPAITKVGNIQNIIHNKRCNSSWAILPHWWSEKRPHHLLVNTDMKITRQRKSTENWNKRRVKLAVEATIKSLMSDKLTPWMLLQEIPHQSFCKHLLNTFLSPCLCLQSLLHVPRSWQEIWIWLLMLTEPWLGREWHCAVFLGKTLYSHSVFLHNGVWMCSGELSALGNPVMD